MSISQEFANPLEDPYSNRACCPTLKLIYDRLTENSRFERLRWGCTSRRKSSRLDGVGEVGLNYCLKLVSLQIDSLFYNVQEREEKKGGAA